MFVEGLESDINLLKDAKYKVDSYVLFSAPWNHSYGRVQNLNEYSCFLIH